MVTGLAPKTPRVSVILAVYNGERFLSAAIGSILRQTFGDFEFIIVNDGSTDRSREIALSYGDSRVRLLDNPRNIGLTRSLNRGVAAARGNFVARLDADDLATPDRLARQIAFLEQQPDISAAGTWCDTIDEHGRRLGRNKNPINHEFLRWSLIFYCPFTHSSMLWRRQTVAETVGEYDSSFAYAMDWEYWSRIASKLRVANIPRVLTHYRVGAHSMTANHPSAWKEIRAAREASLRAVFGGDAERWIAESARLFTWTDGWPEDTGQGHVRESIEVLGKLHEDFVDRLEITGRALDAHARFVREWMAKSLLAAARKSHLAGQTRLGRVLFSESIRVHALALLSRSSGRYFTACIRVATKSA